MFRHLSAVDAKTVDGAVKTFFNDFVHVFGIVALVGFFHRLLGDQAVFVDQIGEGIPPPPITHIVGNHILVRASTDRFIRMVDKPA